MKSRSSTGVGQKIDLEYNIETMRITDEDPDDTAGANFYNKAQPSANTLLNSLKTSSTIIDQTTGEILEPAAKRIVADVQGNKLKSLLNSLNK